MSYEQSRKLINRLTIISTIVIIGLCIYWYQLGTTSTMPCCWTV